MISSTRVDVLSFVFLDEVAGIVAETLRCTIVESHNSRAWRPRAWRYSGAPQMPKRRDALYRATPVERAFDGVCRWIWNEGFFNTVFWDDAGLSWFADIVFYKLVTYSVASEQEPTSQVHLRLRLAGWTHERSRPHILHSVNSTPIPSRISLKFRATT